MEDDDISILLLPQFPLPVSLNLLRNKPLLGQTITILELFITSASCLI